MLPTQLHIGSTALHDMKPIQNHILKPIGGFWTSTYRDDTSAWIDWCIDANMFLPDDSIWRGMLLEVDPSARVAVIDSYPDLLQLIDSYGSYSPFDTDYMQSLDFEAVAKHVDGIHLTQQGLIQTRYAIPYSLYGWDVESTVWFRDVFTSYRSITIPR